MMDGRFDQHFAELFAASLDTEDRTGKQPPLWPLVLACIGGLAAIALAAVVT